MLHILRNIDFCTIFLPVVILTNGSSPRSGEIPFHIHSKYKLPLPLKQTPYNPHICHPAVTPLQTVEAVSNDSIFAYILYWKEYIS